MSEKSYRFIVNPVSGKWKQTKKITAQIEKRFAAESIHSETVFTEKPGHAAELAADAAEKGYYAVISVGGDGTLNETASSLVNSNTALGVIPRGSGNGFARSFNIPLKIKDTLEYLASPKEKIIDVGQINGRYFFGLAGVGIDADVGAQFQEFGTRGGAPYFYIAVKAYFNFDFEEIEIISKEKNYKGTPFIVTIANTEQYGQGALINPGADAEDGLFEVCIVEPFKLMRNIFQIPKLFIGNIDTFRYYSRFQTDSLKIIRSRENGYFHTDGEPQIGGKEINIRVLKKALKVLV